MQQLKRRSVNLIADYDADNYDYRTHWKKRAYEQWAESYALQHLFNSVGQAKWLIDLGGGFGRNAIHYLQKTDHAVIVDYSNGNLERAASTYACEIENGHLFLIRADLYHLPFIDGAFEMGMTIRVLHHLIKMEEALQEMGRVIGRTWLLDVPIKHHIFALLRAICRGKTDELSSGEHKLLGSDDTPFASFHLAQVRYILSQHGWENHLVASVNNFRRWDQSLPAWLTTSLRPIIYGLEIRLQRLGKGWWGPSQFVYATRKEQSVAQARVKGEEPQAEIPWNVLTTKMVCPVCCLPLHWFPNEACCETCGISYPRRGAIWDFVPQKGISM